MNKHCEVRNSWKLNKSKFSNSFPLETYSSETFRRFSSLMDFVLDFNFPFNFWTLWKKLKFRKQCLFIKLSDSVKQTKPVSECLLCLDHSNKTSGKLFKKLRKCRCQHQQKVESTDGGNKCSFFIPSAFGWTNDSNLKMDSVRNRKGWKDIQKPNENRFPNYVSRRS